MDFKQTAKQVLREFWAPFFLALCWATYEWVTASEDDKTLSNSIKAFGAAFFFTSWLLAQWLRIRKQQKVESGLSNIEASVNKTLGELEVRTRDVANHITGGDSVCYFQFLGELDEDGNIARLGLRHHGEYPLYGISVRISDCDADLEKFGIDAEFSQVYEAQLHKTLEDLSPKMAQVWPVELVLGNAKNRNFRANFYARNGNFVQLMKFERVGEHWLCAIKILRNRVTVFERIPNNFPLNENGQIDWIGTGKPYI